MKLTFECECGNKVETRVTYESEYSVKINFPDGTSFGGDDSGYVYLTCGNCDARAEVAGI